MAESDDENFATYGNALEPLDEENLPRKKPVTIEDQYALDQQGRRRFHGAFTGGFSAGYFNSVGTRDGWRPQQFKSSRSSKADGVSQRPEDFMDEEDTGEFGIAPTGIRANSDFTDHSRRGTKRERLRRDNDGPIPGVPVLKELLKPVKDTVGVTLLKKMGWRPGQGIGPRVTKREKTRTRRKNEKTKIYGCSLPNQSEKIEDSDVSDSDDERTDVLFAPDDYEPFLCNPKDNYFGIGYTGLDRRPVLSGHVNLFEEPTLKLQEKNKKFSIRGQAFGVGAFEADDEDIYQRDDMSRYDFALGPESKSKSRWSKSDVESSKENCLDGFQPARKELARKKMFEAPELPRGFEPVHRSRKSRFHPPIEAVDRGTLEDGRKKGLARHDLNAHSRAAILGDSSTEIARTEKSSSSEPKGSQVACNIIARTLNLHGKDQTEERRLQESQRTKSGGATWLEKLSSQSFVKGGVEGSDPNASGSLKNLEDFRSNVAESASSNEFSKPFVADADKQRRYEKFLELATKGEKDKFPSVQPLTMTEWEREHERGEFEQAARLFERTCDTGETTRSDYLKKYGNESNPMGDKFVGIGAEATAPSEAESSTERMKNAARMRLFGKLTRLREPWQPASLVCKRFNIPEPRTGCAKPDERAKNKRFSVFDSLEVGSSERFERATDTAGSFKEPHIAYKPSVRSRNDETSTCNDSSRIIDTSDIDASSSKSSEKIRSFEASYEKVFGRANPVVATTSAMRDADVINERETAAMSNEATTPSAPSASENTAEKKDLFKAIFLSSSEDSETENDEDDSEAVKSLLIGKPHGEINAQRNTSPPRGIFAKLDLDSLTKPAKKDELSREIKASGEAKSTEKSVASPEVEVAVTPEVELPPDMYGPVLPAKGPRSDEISSKDEATSSMDSATHRPIFRSVVVPKTDTGDTDRLKGKWVERTKSKKSKKEKHKHKHKEKERSRHKHKSKKDKR